MTTHVKLFNQGPTLYPGVDAFKAGASLVIQAMLQSPAFLYRTELGLPLLETFLPRKAAAQTAVRSPFVLIVVGDNGVVQAGVSLKVSSEPEKF